MQKSIKRVEAEINRPVLNPEKCEEIIDVSRLKPKAAQIKGKARHISAEWRKRIEAQLILTPRPRAVVAVLGCSLTLVEEVKARLGPEHFFDETQRQIAADLRRSRSPNATAIARKHPGSSPVAVRRIASLINVHLSKKSSEKPKP